jgi:hypothetical protein
MSMSSGAIFLIQDNGQLMEMNEQEYDSEDVLQTLLAKYPNLLAGDKSIMKHPADGSWFPGKPHYLRKKAMQAAGQLTISFLTKTLSPPW